MAVHDRTYRGYDGPRTAGRSRLLVLPRYAFQGVFSSKLFTAFYTLCFVPTIVAAVMIYLRHNAHALSVLELRVDQLVVIDADFFFVLLGIQGIALGSLIALIVGPGLISRDLVHNALPLYLARPISRTEYVLGKMSVLVFLLSLVTWIPDLLLVTIEGWLEGGGWLLRNWRIVVAIPVAGLTWIAVLSLLTLAISSVARRKILAQAALFAVFFIGSAFAVVVNGVLGTSWGTALAIGEVVETIWRGVFGIPLDSTFPIPAAWASLLAVCGLCLLMLHRKVRAQEVVR